MASAADYTSLVQELYVAYFGRPADPVGLAFYENALLMANAPTTDVALGAAYSTNPAVAAIINGFGNSPESAKLYGGTDADFVTAIFENVLGRPPLIAGLLSFVAAIENGTLTRTEAALNIISDAANNVAGNAQGATDALTVVNKLGVAANFTAGLNTTALVTSYEGSAAASDARQLITSVTSTGTPTSYAAAVTATTTTISGIITGATVALTAGVDTLSAQIFDGVLSATPASDTLNSFDHLTGSAPTNNILNISSDGTGIPAGVTISNIQTVNIHATGDQSANVAAWTGVTALNVTDVGVAPALAADATAAITAAATTAVTVTGDVLTSSGAAYSTQGLTVTGGSSVTVTASGRTNATDVEIGNITVSGATGAVVVNATGSEGAASSIFSTVTVSGGAIVTINSTDTASVATTAPDAGVLTVTGATGAVTVNNTTAITDAAAHAIVGAAVNVTGGTTVTVNDLITADTAADATALATGADGAVTVLDGGAATTVTINETVEAHLAPVTAVLAGALAGGVTAAPGITGVPGSPTPAARAAVPGAIVIGAGEVTIDGSGIGNTQGFASGTITAVTLDNYGASSSINSAVLNTLTLAGAGGGLTVYNVGATPMTALTLDLNGLTDATGLTETGITTLNVVTGAANSTLGAYADASLTTLNVSGADVLQLNAINGSLTKIAVTGAAGFSDNASAHTGGFAALGSAATFTTTSSGAISIAVNDTTQTFVGSTGKDTILVSDLADAAKAVTAGTAAGNELILEGGAYALTAATAALVTGFKTLGVEGNVTGTIDMSVLDATASALDIIGNSTITFTKVATGASVLLDATSTSIAVGYADGAGATDTVSVMLGTASNAAPIAPFELTLQDANLVGIGTVNLITTGAANIMSTLTDNGLSHLNVSGTGGVTISVLDEATTQATSFTLNDTSTGGATISALTDISLGGLTFTGATASTVTTLFDSASLLQITAATGASAAIVTLTDNLLTSLTLSGNVSLGQEATADATKGLHDSSTAGVTVNGSADNAHITLNLTSGAAVSNTDTITVGNGNDYILDASTAGVVNVTVGSGSNLIDLDTGSASTYLATVTLGTTLAPHTATSGADDILVGTVAAAATAPNVVIHGAVTGDDLIFTDVVSSTVALTTLQQTTVTGEANLAAAVLYVDGLASTIAHSATTFEYGGNAYVIESAAAGNGTLTANDGFVELAGLASTTGIVDSGAVALNLTLSTAITTYNGGAANDTFTGVYSNAGGGGDTFLSTDTINGHAGVNTLTINPFAINTATTLVDANFGNGAISNIQDLVFSNTGTGNFGLSTGNHFNADFATLNLTATTTTGTLGLTMNSYVTAAILSTTTTTGNQTINIGTSSGTAADSVTSHSTTGFISITVGNGADTISTNSTTGPITIAAGNGVDSITSTATAGGGVIGITTGAGSDSVTATSVDAVTITSGSTTGDTLLSGTSSVSAALTINASGAATTGAYNITANAAGGTDAINVQGGTGSETYNITLGAHTGVATIQTSEIGVGAQATPGTYAPNTIITGALTNDVIQIIDSAAGTFSSLGAEASVNIGVNAAHNSFPGAGNVQTFTFGGNTYLVEDAASNTPLATSSVIELVGIHTITSVTAGAVLLAS